MNNPNPTVWEEPPPSTKRRYTGPASPLAVDLKANPGRWARYGEYENRSTADKTAARISAGGSRWCAPAGAFEAVARDQGDVSVVYVRYVGGGSK